MLRNTRPSLILVPFLLVGATSCGSSDDDSTGVLPFIIQTTAQSVAGTTPVRVSERYVAYLADEASTGAGTTFNTDMDVIDSVAFVVNTVTRTQTNVGVAAQDMIWLGTHLYMRVSEALDGVPWNADMDMTDQVLVRWTPGLSPTFVATLAPGAGTMVKSNGQLFIMQEDVGAPGMGMTNLGRINVANPQMVEAVTTDVMNAGGLRPTLVGEDEGLVFVTVDENADADLNGDADGTDAFVLGLIDATIASPMLHNVGLGVASASVPFRALSTGTSDWLVGFLVNEAAQALTATTGYNDRILFGGTWEPTHCSMIDDTDTLDNVLFFLNFADFINTMTPVPPVNTGLVGMERVVAVAGFVGTISLESDDGGCDLNNDTDTLDRVFRWVAATTPVLPPTSPTNHLLALADAADVPFGTAGVAELQGRFVTLVSEANDQGNYDGQAGTDFNLLGWYNPATSSAFTFDHGSGGSFFGGASWMMETRGRTRLLIGRPEDVDGTNENVVFGADADTLDSLPGFLQFSGTRLSFPTARLAVESGNAGVVIAGGLGFYRVSESEESLDWNQDGDMSDFILARSTFSSGFTTFIGVINDLAGRNAMEVDPDGATVGAAIISDERLTGTDLNGDGDSMDYVLRHFRL
ncbi:MAG: hypothetical protein ACI8QZ_001134 [Chlamydiales bacterium]|jgi:hypothetical protein